MPVDPLDTWKKTHKDLKKVAGPEWAMNFATWYDDRIKNISPDPAAITASSFTFVFNKAIFAAQLSVIPPTPSKMVGMTMFVGAWMSAMALTLFPVTLNVGSGAFIGSPAPPTLFSVINSVIIDPPSLIAAQAKLMELLMVENESDAMDSQMPVKFREATLLLSITVSGLNSIPPPAGPLPLVAPFVALK